MTLSEGVVLLEKHSLPEMNQWSERWAYFTWAK